MNAHVRKTSGPTDERLSKSDGFYVVGDDKQAIYGFRGADSGALGRLERELDADRLERELTALLADPAHLAAMASAMRQGASVDAAERVAAVVEQAARG